MFALENLLEYWSPVVERCGIILDSGEIIELPNTHASPTTHFSFDTSYFKHPNVVASWHTHPSTGPNLSVDDYLAFLGHPEVFHYIVGGGKVWGFYIKDKRVLRYEDSDFSGVPK